MLRKEVFEQEQKGKKIDSLLRRRLSTYIDEFMYERCQFVLVFFFVEFKFVKDGFEMGLGGFAKVLEWRL